MPIKKHTISFVATVQPITELATKFGGQPVWLEQPEWAISRETKEPMRFICQIRLDALIFGDAMADKMAYIFMTDGEEYVDGTWSPDGGENAIIIQPNGDNPQTQPLATGSTLYSMEEKAGFELLQEVPVEFAVELAAGVDPVAGSEDDADGAAYEENKIGGSPVFLQSEEYPDGDKERWRLLLQLDSVSAPFYVNFGDAGVGYAFISRDGRTGKFLWQCL